MRILHSRAALEACSHELDTVLGDSDARDLMPDWVIRELARARTRLAVELHGHAACYSCGAVPGHGTNVALYRFDAAQDTAVRLCDEHRPDGDPIPDPLTTEGDPY